jgi:hypothetical protein
MTQSSNIKKSPINGANPLAQAYEITASSNVENPTNGAKPPAQAEEIAAPAAVRDFIDQVPPAIAPLFSNPPVLRTEDPNAYKAMLNQVAATIKPKDLIEFCWTRDFTDLWWEALRYRHMRKTMATSRQTLANRRNAALSCGPKTAAGTARPRLNAVRHGLAAQPDPHVAHEEILNGLPPQRKTARVHPARRSLRQSAALQRGSFCQNLVRTPIGQARVARARNQLSPARAIMTASVGARAPECRKYSNWSSVAGAVSDADELQ